MKVTWIGQGGLLFEHNEHKIMLDPYLPNSVEKINQNNFRRAYINEDLFGLDLDIMIFTHNHLDHYDPETVEKFITPNSNLEVLCPESVWKDVKKFGGNNNYIMFNRHTVWSKFGLKFTAVKAEHSDCSAIGVIIDDGEKKYYVTGDTLYNTEIFDDIPNDVYALFMPVNGVGNNMNIEDAKNFALRVNARHTIPMHFGMFDEIVPAGFSIIPKIYKEITFE